MTMDIQCAPGFGTCTWAINTLPYWYNRKKLTCIVSSAFRITNCFCIITDASCIFQRWTFMHTTTKNCQKWKQNYYQVNFSSLICVSIKFLAFHSFVHVWENILLEQSEILFKQNHRKLQLEDLSLYWCTFRSQPDLHGFKGFPNKRA